MNIQIVKRKAGSNKELDRKQINIKSVRTLRELLIKITTYTFEQQFSNKDLKALSDQEIAHGKTHGKIVFQAPYNDQKESLDSAISTMIQDFEDGLFRIFIQGDEYTELDEELQLQDHDEVVILRLIMLAGRLW